MNFLLNMEQLQGTFHELKEEKKLIKASAKFDTIEMSWVLIN